MEIDRVLTCPPFLSYMQAAQLQLQVQQAEAELSRMSEAQAGAAQRVAAMQAELAAAHEQAATAQSALEAAARDASQARGKRGSISSLCRNIDMHTWIGLCYTSEA